MEDKVKDKNHHINLIVGDWSGDGHCKTSHYTVSSNKTKDEVLKAYKNGVKIIGVDLAKNVCRQYQESSISNSDLNLLITHGLSDFEPIDDDRFNDEDSIELEPDWFVDIWLFITRKGDADLVLELVDNDSIHVGGYGLFT